MLSVSSVEVVSTVSVLSVVSETSLLPPPDIDEKISRAISTIAAPPIIRSVLKSFLPPPFLGEKPVEIENELLSSSSTFPSALSCSNCCSVMLSNTPSVLYCVYFPSTIQVCVDFTNCLKSAVCVSILSSKGTPCSSVCCSGTMNNVLAASSKLDISTLKKNIIFHLSFSKMVLTKYAF